MKISKFIVVLVLGSLFLVPPAHATLGMQELGDSLFVWTGFSRVWSPPVRVKQLRISGNNVTLHTNATLKDVRWTSDNLADIKRRVSYWTLGHGKGKVIIYAGKTDVSTLITDCARQTAKRFDGDLTNRNIALWPSHGLYFNRDRQAWIWQRAALWTTVEDLYSQEYVRLVKRMLENSGANVIMPRAGLDQQERGVSGMPQWTEGARYNLIRQGADSAIWNLYEGNEYKDDMKCRAMWVNALETPVDLCLAFHTDGLDSGDDTTIVGTLAIYTAKDDDNSTRLRDGRDREKINRDLADWVQTQVTEDLRHIAPEWTRRQLKEANYCESRVPVVPSIILELLSHKNMADMKYGLDPNFRFAAARAVYKGILRYLNGPNAIIQPLPVQELGITPDGLLQWRETQDTIEVNAAPTYYMVYIQADDDQWDVQQVENETELQLELQKGVKYNFYVVAGNNGGLSLPSPVISAYLTSDSEAVLIVDAFNDTYGPEWFADSTYAGIVPGSYACENYLSCAYIGEQWDFTRSHPWISDDNCGWGSCHRDHAGQITVGNTHDYIVKHGNVLRRLNIPYVSCTAGMLSNSPSGLTSNSASGLTTKWSLIDFICGRNRTPLTADQLALIAAYLDNGGRLLLSTDHFSAIEPDWAKQYLHAAFQAGHATRSGRITDNQRRRFRILLEPNDQQLFTCTPEAVLPLSEAAVYAAYDDLRCPAAVSSAKPLLFAFPLETVQDFDGLYEQALRHLLSMEE